MYVPLRFRFSVLIQNSVQYSRQRYVHSGMAYASVYTSPVIGSTLHTTWLFLLGSDSWIMGLLWNSRLWAGSESEALFYCVCVCGGDFSMTLECAVTRLSLWRGRSREWVFSYGREVCSLERIASDWSCLAVLLMRSWRCFILVRVLAPPVCYMCVYWFDR